MWIIQMNVPIAKRTDENCNFSVANDPDRPNELACCKKDSPERHFSVANDPNYPNEPACCKNDRWERQLFCCKWSSKWTSLLQKGRMRTATFLLQMIRIIQMNWPVAKRTVQSGTFLLQMIWITFLGQTSFKDLFPHMPNWSRVDWLLQAHGYSLDIVNLSSLSWWHSKVEYCGRWECWRGCKLAVNWFLQGVRGPRGG